MNSHLVVKRRVVLLHLTFVFGKNESERSIAVVHCCYHSFYGISENR